MISAMERNKYYKGDREQEKAGVSNYFLVVDIEDAKTLSLEHACQFQQEQGAQSAQGRTNLGEEDSR